MITAGTLNIPFLKLLAAAAATLVVYGTWKVVAFLTKPWRSNLRYLPGPKNDSFFWGNMRQIQKAESQTLHEEWAREYGSTFKYKGFFLVCFFNLFDVYVSDHR